MDERQVTDKTAHEKLETLRGILGKMGSVLVAYSGGVDSTFLLNVARQELSDRVLAVTAVSATYPREEHERACGIARSFGVRHRTITTDELQDPDFCQNPPERCYHCKKELFRKLKDIAASERIACVVDATNLDDCSDYRPGRRAAEEKGVRSPLVEAGITKDEIRALSKHMGLPTWDMPSMACLASRFPYGEAITAEKLERIHAAEIRLRELGFRQTRVRGHGPLARIEVPADRVHELTAPELRQKIVRELKELGFVYVTVDLQGYRTGSLNEVLSEDQAQAGRGD